MALTRIDSYLVDLDSLGGITFDDQAGVPTFKVDAVNHRVGIGTTNPGTKLDIYGDIAINGTFAIRRKDYGYSATYKNVLIGSPDSVANTVSLCVDVSTISGGNFHGQNQVIIPRQGLLVPNNAGTNFIGVLSRDSNDYIRIGPDAPGGGISGGPITVTTSNVGIGTTNPPQKLYVNGNVQSTGRFIFGGSAEGGARSLAAGSGATIVDTGITINATNGGGTMLVLACKNTSNGTATQSAVYMLQFYYDGDNTPTKTLISGSDIMAINKSATNTLTVTCGTGNWAVTAFVCGFNIT